MKKRILPAILAIILVLLSFSGCSTTSPYSDTALVTAENYTRLTPKNTVFSSATNEKKAKNALDGDNRTSYKSKEKTGYIEFDFGEEVTFDTLVVREKGWNVESFSFSTGTLEKRKDPKEGEKATYIQWKSFYEQDRMEDARLCSFEKVTTRYLKLEVQNSLAPFSIAEVELYLSDKIDKDMRVSAYVSVSQNFGALDLTSPTSGQYLDSAYFDVVTQLLFLGCTSVKDDGEIMYNHKTLNDEMMAKGLAQYRAVTGKDVEFFMDFQLLGDPFKSLEENREKTIDNMINIALKHGIQGISFDWEFPKNKAEYDLFSDFLVALKVEMNKHNLKLATAWASWGIKLKPEAIAIIDQVEIMAYDCYDQSGNNSGFLSSGVQPIQYFLDLGFTKQQLNLGIPFYGRPLDTSNVWVDYKYHSLGEFNNRLSHPYYADIWFNGVQMTRDKAALAIASELGGIMLFHIGEDLPYSNELSLVRAVGTTLDARTVKGVQ